MGRLNTAPMVLLFLVLGSAFVHAAHDVEAAAAAKAGSRNLLWRASGERPYKNGAQAMPANTVKVVLHFNQLGQLAIRSTGVGLQLAAKFLAMVHNAQRTAIRQYSLPADQVAVAAYAGHAVLCRLFPLLSITFDNVMLNYTATIPQAKRDNMEARAQKIAQSLVATSMNDGSAVWADWYRPPKGDEPDGVYRFTQDQTFSLLPQLANCTPMVIDDPADFEQGGPSLITSSRFQADLDEVRQVGEKGSSAANAETAYFWFDGPGTSSAAGHWSDIASSLLPDNTTAYQAADLLFRLNAAMFDASVVCWYSKYKYNYWRPYTALRARGYPTWTPLMLTPFHPEHPSGHSCAGGAAGAVLTARFGANVGFTIGSEYPVWTNPTLPKRTYSSFRQAVEEGMTSRVYAGVHFRRAVEVGAAIGDAVGRYVWNNADV